MRVRPHSGLTMSATRPSTTERCASRSRSLRYRRNNSSLLCFVHATHAYIPLLRVSQPPTSHVPIHAPRHISNIFYVPPTPLPPQYAPFAYDAMQAMLFAFDALASRRGPGPLSVTAREVYEAMLAVNFSGISGQVCSSTDCVGVLCAVHVTSFGSVRRIFRPTD